MVLHCKVANCINASDFFKKINSEYFLFYVRIQMFQVLFRTRIPKLQVRTYSALAEHITETAITCITSYFIIFLIRNCRSALGLIKYKKERKIKLS
jgi:hypothetical protein